MNIAKQMNFIKNENIKKIAFLIFNKEGFLCHIFFSPLLIIRPIENNITIKDEPP